MRGFHDSRRNISLPRIFNTVARLEQWFRRWKRGCLLVVIIMALLCLALCVAAIFLVGRASAQETGMQPLDVVLIIDHSDSMWDKGGVGSDPDLLRIEAANLLIAYLGVDSAQPGNRLGVVHFGGRSELIVPLTPLDSAGQRQAIRSAIAAPQRMGWTDPLAALQLADQTLFPQNQRHLARQPVVVLLTDGKPELVPSPGPAERTAYLADLRALVERFREQDCPIFTVALTSAATDADPEIQTVYRNLWQEIAAHTSAEYHEARVAGDLLPIYHAIVARLTGAEIDTPTAKTVVNGRATEAIVVAEELAQVRIVVWRSDPALVVRLLRPEGIPARPGDPDVRHSGEPGRTREEIWAIADPRPGRWTLEFEGQGSVMVWQDAVAQTTDRPSTYAIEATDLPAYIPAGQPLSVSISLRQSATRKVAREPGIQIVAQVRRADFLEATLLARDDGLGCDAASGDGLYCAVLPDPPAGVCALRLRALQDGAEIARGESIFEGVPLPQLAIVAPRPGLAVETGAPLTIAVRVQAGDRALAAVDLVGQGTLTANLRSAAGAAVAVPLAADGDSFVGHVAAPGAPGPFTLIARLRGQTPEGLSYRDAQSVQLVALVPTGPDVRRGLPGWTWLLTGLGVVGAASSAAGLIVRRIRQRATLEGSLRVLSLPLPNGERAGVRGIGVLDLPPVSALTLGGMGKHDLLPGLTPRATLRAARTPEGDAETWIAPFPGEDAQTLTLNGRPLGTARRLYDGDVLTLGEYRLRYESLRQAGARRASRRPSRRGMTQSQ